MGQKQSICDSENDARKPASWECVEAGNNAHPDQKYIVALLSNNEALLHELYKKYSGKIKSMVLQENGTEKDAADVFQDALLTIYYCARNRQFELTSSFDTFFYRVCRNKWMDKLGK